MNKRTSATIVFVILCAACVAHALYYYPLLPEKVATHFGPSGRPDAWGGKMQFFIVYLVTVGVMAAIFLGLGLFLTKFPDDAFTLPNKDYWLAPERRRETLAYIFSCSLWLGSLTIVLLFDLAHQSFQVHLGKATRLDHFWISMGIYLTIVTMWCIATYRKVNKKGASPTCHDTRRHS